MTIPEIRQARQEDCESILDCLAAAFAPYRRQYTRAAYIDTVLDPSSLRNRMQSMHILVAMADGTIVGTVGASAQGEEGHLRGMAVLPEARGTGVAARLLNAIEDWLMEQGCRQVSLDTTKPLEAAMKFYEKHGYARSGRVSEFFGMDLIEYVKPLR